MTTKARLHRLVDELSEEEAEQAFDLIHEELKETVDAFELAEDKLDDPVLQAFRDAPEDDEPLTPEDEVALERSRQEYRRGEGVPLDAIRHEFS